MLTRFKAAETDRDSVVIINRFLSKEASTENAGLENARANSHRK